MSRTDASLTAELRASTAELHARAERHAFVARLFGGHASRDAYAAYLGELAWIHGALEEALARVGAPCGLGSLPEHVENLARDLRHFGREARGAPPRPATRRLCEAIERAAAADPAILAGFVYVLEGSMNGARFLAQSVRRALGLPPEEGTAYLDPYGDLQPSIWQEVRRRLDALPRTPEQERAIVGNASATFEGIAGVLDDLESEALAPAPEPPLRARA